jgi:uncharacterized protein (DUF1501 family)
MLKLSTSTAGRNCSGFTRRDFLQFGSLGMAGLTLPALMRDRAARAADQRPTKETSVVWLFLSGGPSHIDTYDMKPAACWAKWGGRRRSTSARAAITGRK